MGVEFLGLAVALYGLASGSVNPYATFAYATLVYTPNATISAWGVVIAFAGFVLHVLKI